MRYFEDRSTELKINKAKRKNRQNETEKREKKKTKIGKSDTFDKRRKPNFGNALAKAAIKKFTGLEIEDWGHN